MTHSLLLLLPFIVFCRRLVIRSALSSTSSLSVVHRSYRLILTFDALKKRSVRKPNYCVRYFCNCYNVQLLPLAETRLYQLAAV